MALADKPFTTKRLAERWDCSNQHIHNLIAQGKLAKIPGMGRMVRIPVASVIALEEGTACISESAPVGTTGSFAGQNQGAAVAAFRLERATRGQPKLP